MAMMEGLFGGLATIGRGARLAQDPRSAAQPDSCPRSLRRLGGCLEISWWNLADQRLASIRGAKHHYLQIKL